MLYNSFSLSFFILFSVANFVIFVESTAPKNGVLVFAKGEGGYYCHKIPYIFQTESNVLIAMAEARGKGGTTCDDFTVISNN